MSDQQKEELTEALTKLLRRVINIDDAANLLSQAQIEIPRPTLSLYEICRRFAEGSMSFDDVNKALGN